MKTSVLISAILFVASLNMFLKHIASQEIIIGPHGGIVKQADKLYIEKKQSRGNLYAFLLDTNLKPIENKGITAEVRFYFSDNTTTDIPLKQFESEGFIVAMDETDYLSCRITFVVSGRSVSAKFDNENMIVNKQNNKHEK